MQLGLEKKVAVVTGGSKGIGKAAAVALAGEGCRVAISARGEKKLQRTAEEIRQAGGEVLPLAGDMTSVRDIEKFVNSVVERWQTVHILVNNVGSVGNAGSFEEVSDEDWMNLFELNVLSAIRLIRLVLPYMKEQQWGRIINISSESGIQPDPFMPHYNVTKAALINLTKSLSKAYGQDKILVNTVSPAFIRTPLVESMMVEEGKKQGVSTEEVFQQFLAQNRPHIVLKRPGLSEEVAAAVVFLASERASFVTGSNYRVDGGSVASQ